MPTSQDLLQQLFAIASEHETIAIAWHVAILAAAVWFVRSEPTTEHAVAFAIAPLVSVFLVAAGHESWFNASTFGVLAFGLLASRAHLAPRWRTCVPEWSSVVGVAMILFGLWYPHFTEGPWYRSLYVSPIGLLPCPTLAVVAGITLLAGGFGTRAIPVLLAASTLFYGAIGAFRLEVRLDILLLVATAGLVRLAFHNARFVEPARSA